MKWSFRTNPTGYIGVHHAHGSTSIAAVKLHGDQLETVASIAGEGDPAALIERLDADVRRWPIAVTLPPQAGLHRSLALPPADHASLSRMIELQLESLYPLRDTTLRWGHARASDTAPVWVYLAAAPSIEHHTPPLPPRAALAAAVAQEMALIALLLERDPDASMVLVVTGEAHAAVAVMIDGRLHGVAQTDLEGDEAQRLAALDEALQATMDDPAPARRPTKLLGVGPASSVADALAAQWRMTRVTLSEQLGESDEAAALAQGAATAALRRRVAALHFDHDPAMPVEDRRNLQKRLLWAGAWLAAAVVALAAIDLRNAAMLEQERIDTVMSAQQRDDLQQQRALGNHLQALGPTPLAILDEIGRRTRTIQLDDIRYDAAGDFRLRGKMRSTETVNELVNALSQMQTLEDVSLVSQRSAGRDEVEFEIAARTNRRFLGAFASPPEVSDAARADRQARRDVPEDTP